MRLCLFLHIWQLQKTNTDMRCSQVNGAHLKVFLRSDSPAKGSIPELGTQETLWILKSWAVLSFSKNLSNGYSSGAWLDVSLRYWSGRNLTAVKSLAMLESRGQLWGMDPKQQGLVTASEEPQISSALPVLRRLKFCPGGVTGLLCDFGSTCPPVKGDVSADFLCILCGEPYKKTEIRGKCCNTIWYHKTTTRIFYSIPGEIKTYADLISYEFCKLHLPRNGRQKSDHNRSVRFDEKSTEEAGLLQHHGDGSDWSPAAKVDQVATVSARQDTSRCLWGSHGLTFTWADNLQLPTIQITSWLHIGSYT